MKRFLRFCFLLLFPISAFALDNGHVKYTGGTIPGVAAGVVGRLDTTSETSLTFQQAGTILAIPYASIESFQYTKEVARHLGVLPAIAVRLLKVRQRRHYFQISYRNPQEIAEVAIFEVPKHMQAPLQSVLDTRVSRTSRLCLPRTKQGVCGPDTALPEPTRSTADMNLPLAEVP